MTTTATITPPRVGMVANVRNRRGIISSVDPFDSHTEGRLHMVRVEYADGDGALEDQLVWEREIGARLLEPAALPRLSETAPMNARQFDSLVRATRWTALHPYTDPDGGGPLPRRPAKHGGILPRHEGRGSADAVSQADM